MGSVGDGARIYYRFVPEKFELEILAYSNKAKQTRLTNRMERLYDKGSNSKVENDNDNFNDN